MTAKENQTETALRAAPPDEKPRAELAIDEQVGITRGSAVQGEAARVENANRIEGSPSFFSPAQTQAFRSRWNDIQVGFVDDPAHAVDEANALVSDAIEHLKQGFTEQRQPLDPTSDPNKRDSTEERRLLLRRYRTLVERLVSI